jgi:hypothetical protein
VTQWLKIMGTDGVHGLIVNGKASLRRCRTGSRNQVKSMELDGVIHLVTPTCRR